MSHDRRRRLVPFLMLAALVLADGSALLAQDPGISRGRRVASGAAERTDAGVWDGTWIYVYRDGRMALWLRTREGKPELKIQFQSTATPEAFETDWNGRADYVLAGEPAVFEMAVTEGDENTLKGTWTWKVEFRTSGRSETGRFTLYRAGDGRHMVLRFDEYEKTIRKGERGSTFKGTPAWGFRKVSKRLALWEELPF